MGFELEQIETERENEPKGEKCKEGFSAEEATADIANAGAKAGKDLKLIIARLATDTGKYEDAVSNIRKWKEEETEQ